MHRRVLFGLLALTVCSCRSMMASGPATNDQLLARASYDLGCPTGGLVVTPLDDRTRGVLGCSKRATYTEQCEAVTPLGAKDKCTWVPSAPPAPAP
jgi:hypothetical protein